MTRVSCGRVLRKSSQSYTGKELFRILFDNKIKPIVLIAFTNHALDHMLNSILDAKITKKFVRLGSRSTDERIAEYSLMNLQKTFTDASMTRQIGRENAIKKRIEEKMLEVLNDIQIPDPSEGQIREYLEKDWAEHLYTMFEPPFWIAEYATRLWASEEGEEGEWKVKEKKGKGKEQSHLMARTYYGLWRRGLDIAFIQPPQPRLVEAPVSKKKKKKQVQPEVLVAQPTEEEQKKYQERMFEFFNGLGFGDSVPPVPMDNRPFVQLQDSPLVWSMSLQERQRLAEHWEEEMRRLAYHDHLEEYQNLREEYEAACGKFEDVTDEVRYLPMLNIMVLMFPTEEAPFIDRC